MSIIDTLINFIKPKKHISGDILTVETNNGEILNLPGEKILYPISTLKGGSTYLIKMHATII